MKKQLIRFFSLVMLVVLFVTIFSMQVNAKVVFKDLKPTHWCYNKIIDFEEKGYVCGYEDGTFRPDRQITRAEYVKIVNNFFGYKLNTKKVAKFSDVSSDDWFAPYVNEAVSRGYITGYEDGTFRPQDPIRRQEATVILARILDIDEEVYPQNHVDGLAQYSDGDEVQEWARVAIHSYSVYNFINGYEDGSLRILQNVTRAETVELLNILEKKIVIDRDDPTPSRKSVKIPTIALWKQEKSNLDRVDTAVNSTVTLTKSGWVNNAQSTIRGNDNGVLVNITTTTKGATINEALTGNKTDERHYVTTSATELDNALFLTDGEYKVSAYASKTGYKSSKSAEKTILVDTKSPNVVGKVSETTNGEAVAHKHSVNVNVYDPKSDDVNRISGVDKQSVRYAWFKIADENNQTEYIRVGDWKAIALDENNNFIVTTEGLDYGSYKLGVSVLDIAENAYGSRTDTIITLNGQQESIENIQYDFVEEIKEEQDPEKPQEDPDIVVVVGNNLPTVEDLIMKTKVGVTVSKNVVATDKDGDTLSYSIKEADDYIYASILEDGTEVKTSYKHNTAGIYHYNIKVTDGIDTVEALVTVYVYDVTVVTPGEPVIDPEKPNEPGEETEYDVTTKGVTLFVGEEKELTAKVNPSTSTEKDFSWSEEAEEIKIVSGANTDTVTIKGELPGSAKIKVIVNVDGVNIEKEIDVIVKSKINIKLPSYKKEYDGKKLSASDEFKKENSEYETSPLKITGVIKSGDKIELEDISGEIVNFGKGNVNNNGNIQITDANTNDRKGYYEVEFESGKLEITKRGVTLTSATAEKAYDGNALTNSNVEESGKGFVDGEGAEYNVTGTQTSVGSSKNKFTYTLKEGTKAENYDIKTVEGTLTVKEKPLLGIKTFIRDDKDDNTTIDEYYYNKESNDTFWYVIKIYNEKQDSLPKKVVSAEVTDTLPEYVTFVSASVDDTTETIEYNAETNTVKWNAKNIGYGTDAKYAYIEVKLNPDVFKEWKQEIDSANVITNITATAEDTNFTGIKDTTLKNTSLFIRFGGATNSHNGYLFAGTGINANKTDNLNPKVEGQQPDAIFINGYDDSKINTILGENDETKIADMLDDFKNNSNDVTKYVESLPTMAQIRKNIKDMYNVDIPENYTILWYKFVREDEERKDRTYTIVNEETDTSTHTISPYSENTYHMDGILVDVSMLNYIPEGTMAEIENIAEVKATGISDKAKLKVYYGSKLQTLALYSYRIELNENLGMLGNQLPSEATPVEGEATPVEGEATPVEGEATPVEGEATPVEGEATPVEGEATPVEGEATPVEGEATPVEGEVTPVEGEATPVEGEATPVEGETTPVEGEATPVEGEATPVEGEATLE